MAKEGYKWALHIHFLSEYAQKKFRPVTDEEFLFDKVLPVPLAIQVLEKADPARFKHWLHLHHGTEDLVGKTATIEVADPTVLVISFTTQTIANPGDFLFFLSMHHPICQIHMTVTPPARTKDAQAGEFSTYFYGLPHPVFEIEETLKMIIDEMGDEAIDEVQTLYADFICQSSLFWERAIERGLYRRLRVQFRERLGEVCKRMDLPILEHQLVKIGKWDSPAEAEAQGRLPTDQTMLFNYWSVKHRALTKRLSS